MRMSRFQVVFSIFSYDFYGIWLKFRPKYVYDKNHSNIFILDFFLYCFFKQH